MDVSSGSRRLGQQQTEGGLRISDAGGRGCVRGWNIGGTWGEHRGRGRHENVDRCIKGGRVVVNACIHIVS